MVTLQPKQTSHHRQLSPHVPVELQDCRFVFICHDTHRKPLQCTYDGPFRVLERATKYFTLDLNGKRDTMSVDRLKPAFLDADWGLCEEPVTAPPTRTQPALHPAPSTVEEKTSMPPAPPPSTAAKEARIPQSRGNTPLQIVKRSRGGRVIRHPARLQ